MEAGKSDEGVAEAAEAVDQDTPDVLIHAFSVAGGFE
jgi:hypothetical protein